MREENLINKFKKSQDFGNSLRDRVIENLIQNEVGSSLDVNNNKLQLKSKSGKLLGNEIPFPEGGGDDFLKKILTTPKDTLIDLGYKDSVSGNEVYAIRRNFDVVSLQQSTFQVVLGQSISKVITAAGCFYADGASTDFPIPDRDRNKVEGGVYHFKVINSSDRDLDISIDTYFVFVGTKEYLTYEDVGDVIIFRPFALRITETDCEVTVTDQQGNVVEAGKGSLEYGETYTINVSYEDGYSLEYATLNTHSILENLPYSFVCDGDAEIRAFAKEHQTQKYYYVHSEQLCSVTLVDSEGNEVSSGMYSLVQDQRYTLSIVPCQDCSFSEVIINGVQFDWTQLPYTFVCDGPLSVEATCVRDSSDLTVIVKDSETNDPIEYISVSVGDLTGMTNEEGVCHLNGSFVMGSSIVIEDPYRRDDSSYDYYYDTVYATVMYTPQTITRSLTKVSKQSYDNNYTIHNDSTFDIDILDGDGEIYHKVGSNENWVVNILNLRNFTLKIVDGGTKDVSAKFQGMYGGTDYKYKDLITDYDMYDESIVVIYSPWDDSFWYYNNLIHGYGGDIYLRDD